MPELPELVPSDMEKTTMKEGYKVEEYAKQLKIFSGFVEVKKGDEPSRGMDLVREETPVIYQPTFIANGFIIRCDFLVFNKASKKYDLYEVKATNSLKDKERPHDHISDATFQSIVLERSGVKIGKKFIVHLNNEYIRGDELNIEELFVIEDVTDQVEEKKAITEERISQTKKYLNQETEPEDGCNCNFYGRSRHCATFHRSHPEVPDYGVHDLSRIGMTPRKIEQWVKDEIFHIQEIEDVSDLTLAQQNQIHVHKTGEEIINVEEIAKILNNYNYPLYFFDYETFAPAIPIFKGFKPYQRIPIQFSLHIIKEKGGELSHLEFLQQENADPSEAVAKRLIEYIRPEGTVLAWNDKFEKGVTTEIGERLPQYALDMKRICNQMQDLMDIFSQQHYVHKDFKGRAAIEKVMNVLLPKMTYDNLLYTGAEVGYAWWEHIVNEGPEPEDRARKLKHLLDYCEQDTFVMVEIFRILENVIKTK
jgi:hypothetical protein